MNRLITILIFILFSACSVAMQADSTEKVTAKEISLNEHYFDVKYKKRTLPIKIYVNKEVKEPMPLIIYSHGLGGSRETKKYILEYWAKEGFICVSVQHPGSDESVWKNVRAFERLKAMKKAASAEQFTNRTKDIPAVLDQLEKWNKDKEHKLYKNINFEKVAMSGHSFGAVTSQAMMGAVYPRNQSFADKRFKAFLLMSPSSVPRVKQSDAFGKIKLPVLCMTGTKDSSLIKPDVGYEERVAVYDALPDGQKYLYVFDGGKHNLFSGPTKFSKKLKEEHVIIQKLTLSFWKAHLQNDKAERKILTNFEARKKDIWKFK